MTPCPYCSGGRCLICQLVMPHSDRAMAAFTERIGDLGMLDGCRRTPSTTYRDPVMPLPGTLR